MDFHPKFQRWSNLLNDERREPVLANSRLQMTPDDSGTEHLSTVPVKQKSMITNRPPWNRELNHGCIFWFFMAKQMKSFISSRLWKCVWITCFNSLMAMGVALARVRDCFRGSLGSLIWNNPEKVGDEMIFRHMAQLLAILERSVSTEYHYAYVMCKLWALHRFLEAPWNHIWFLEGVNHPLQAY